MDSIDSSLDHRFRSAFWQAVRNLDVVRLRQWEQWHVTLPQLRVLHQVQRTPGITTGELAGILGITVSTTSGLVTKLADHGLVARGATPGDRRQIALHLSAEGEALVGELRGPTTSFFDELVRQLGDDLGDVTAALERLVAASTAARAGLGTFDGAELIGARR